MYKRWWFTWGWSKSETLSLIKKKWQTFLGKEILLCQWSDVTCTQESDFFPFGNWWEFWTFFDFDVLSVFSPSAHQVVNHMCSHQVPNVWTPEVVNAFLASSQAPNVLPKMLFGIMYFVVVWEKRTLWIQLVNREWKFYYYCWPCSGGSLWLFRWFWFRGETSVLEFLMVFCRPLRWNLKQ